MTARVRTSVLFVILATLTASFTLASVSLAVPSLHHGTGESPRATPRAANVASTDAHTPQPRYPASGYSLAILTIPSYCTITIGLDTFGNGTVYADAPAGLHQIDTNPCPRQAFVNWTTTGVSVNRSTADPATLDIESNGTLTALFTFGYNVTFNETGLLFGTTWTVTINGNAVASSTVNPTLVVFQLSNGTYGYTIGPQPEFATKYSGVVVVSGRNVEVNVTFTSLAYDVEFLSTGLPAETTWSVILNGTQYYSHAPWITFAEVNGTYSYSVPWVGGYTSNVTSGNVTVLGQERLVYLGFSKNATSSSAGLTPLEEYAIVGGGVTAVLAAGSVVLFLRGRTR